MATIDVVLEGDPFTKDALDVVPEIRDSVSDLGPGLTALVGGGSAIQYDFDQAIESDLELIAPIALLVIAIILAILLRALVAPLVLIASVILSFLCTLGISVLFIRYVVGDAGFDASIPTFAFIFLVALGIDYTIFLMARVREEARRHGTREGMLRALAATGPVITSAGIILAGTFSVLMTLPVTFTFDLGFMVALGILLDTFIVRTIMVPAAVELIGDKIWWPSTRRRRRRAPRGDRRAPGRSARPRPRRASGPSSRAFRFSAKAAIPSRKSSEAKQDSRSSISSRSCASVRRGYELRVSIACLLPLIERGAFAATPRRARARPARPQRRPPPRGRGRSARHARRPGCGR